MRAQAGRRKIKQTQNITKMLTRGKTKQTQQKTKADSVKVAAALQAQAGKAKSGRCQSRCCGDANTSRQGTVSTAALRQAQAGEAKN
jgi:hypothetical protein